MKKTALTVLAALLLAGMAAAQDAGTPAPAGVMDGYTVTDVPSNSFTMTETIGDATGMDYDAWFNNDFCFNHTWPKYSEAGIYVIDAKLSIYAWDVDSSGTSAYGPEVDEVYADGVYLGDLEGVSDAWSLTEFDVPNNLIEDGLLEVCIDVDATNVISLPWWEVNVDYSSLAVEYDYEIAAPEAVGAVMAIALASPAFGYLLIRRRR